MHKNPMDICGCFPTGLPYPGIAKYIMEMATPEDLGLVFEIPRNTPVKDIPFALIDTETTGFGASSGDRIIEIAVILFDQGNVTGKYSWIVNPMRRIPWQSTQVHGITDEQVRFRPAFSELKDEISDKLEGRVPVAYNAPFDRRFVHEEMRKAGVVIGKTRDVAPAIRSCTEWIDPLVWARYIDPGQKSYKLSEIVKRRNIILKDAHQASADAEATGLLMYDLFLSLEGMTYCDLVQKQRELIGQGFSKPKRGKK